MQTFWTNFHSHSHFCDGKPSLEEMVQAAIDQNVKSYGFSSHSPVPFSTTWNMPMDRLNEYMNEAKRLKEKYQDQIQLYTGLEVDFVSGKCGVHNFPQLDFSVGSIHFVDTFEDGTYWEIDNTKTIFDRGLQEIFGGNIQRAFKRYYDLSIEMLEEDTPDVLGHMDKFKMHNSTGNWFSEEEEWYKKMVMEYIEVIKESGVIVEVNTRGLYKGFSKDLYPSPWIIKELIDRKIPISLNSDSHTTFEITKGFDEAAELLSSLGLREVYGLWDGEWQPFGFEKQGVILR
ncbi:histidinol-phosphatase HisJ family protein [Flammeovirga yaeyamensis]|uniref:Histidinol-phosphatase n=1 Tax=Flammeovirga yaeyamensis TaxID=367791 RepID=A0AAX1N7W6_9BACT|nr:histidinol-phosphatase [Flammeovirga yaeyamensis]MBB3697899.1 histidinol-phosphatase (PHP family) [Flammeovirga yaeyamensis]NMF35746.1 histidinol-phosphatase [Flammeovirga yaeyamensis]QWG03302.1 histidinol-phosphatase HisJ family protein [Flammeovirga yaeyamensis]